jgi:hypothetical protein
MMNSRELYDILHELPRVHEDVTDFKGWLPPGPMDAHGGTLACRFGPVELLLAIQGAKEGETTLYATAAVADEVRVSDRLFRELNELNANTLVVGRLFLHEFHNEDQTPNGLGAILLQEMVACEYVDSGQSVNVPFQVIGRVGGMASRLSAGLCSRHDGRPWPPESWMRIAMYADERYFDVVLQEALVHYATDTTGAGPRL